MEPLNFDAAQQVTTISTLYRFDLIMLEIMGLLPLEDLKASRRVCRVWNYYATQTMNKKGYGVTFTDKKPISHFAKLIKKTSVVPFHNYILHNSLSANDGLEPFWTYAKRLTIIVDEERPVTRSQINLQNIHTILSVTPNLEYLTIQNLDFPEVAVSKKQVYPEGELARLKSLKISGGFKKWLMMEQDNGFEVVKKLFRIAPNINSITLDFPLDEEGFRLGALGVLLTVLRNVATLKTLRILPPLEPTEYAPLMDSEFKLEISGIPPRTLLALF